jgi:hypothetical protein
MVRFLLPVLCISLLLTSCFEEDTRVKPWEGEVSLIPDSIQVYQSYFDLESAEVVKTVPARSWQLGFECSPRGWHILSNSGANWFVYNTGQPVPDAVITMPSQLNHLFDMQSAFPDSTVVGNWFAGDWDTRTYPGNIYLLGHYREGGFHAVKQVAFLEVNDSTYRFFFKDQSTGFSDTVTIDKNDELNFVHFDLENRQVADVEPPAKDWDLMFGPYYDMATLFGVTIPYQVGGAFLNPAQTEAVLDSVTGFNAINSTLIPGYGFSRQRDIPGYRWKGVTVDVSGAGSATYAVKTHYTYVFHTEAGYYYKLRFLSYSLDGRSGFPRFEYRILE